VNALAHLEMLGHDRHGVVGRDAHEGVGRQHAGRGRRGLGADRLQAELDHEARADGGCAFEELAAGRHHRLFAAS